MPTCVERLLAVDPGLHGCGAALYNEGILEQADYVEGLPGGARPAIWIGMATALRKFVAARPISHLVVELPQVYVMARSKGDPNDLINLAGVVGAICSAFEEASQKIYLPAEWKGQVPKEIMHARASKRLSEQESQRICCKKKSLLHNVKDAVAMGLVFLDRL